MFRLGRAEIATCWDEIAVYLREVPMIDGSRATEDALLTLLHNLLRDSAVLWIITDMEMRPKAAIVGAPMYLSTASVSALSLEAVWSALGFRPDVHREVIEKIAEYAKARGHSAIIAHINDKKYADKVCAAGIFSMSPATVVWRKV